MRARGLPTRPPTASPDFGRATDDNVRAQARLLDSLGLEQLALIYGYSMGAMQALHFGCLYPSRVQRIAAVCGSARCFEGNKVFLESLRAAASADPTCEEGWFAEPHPPRALRAFARVYAGWGVSPAFYRRELWREGGFTSLEDFL